VAIVQPMESHHDTESLDTPSVRVAIRTLVAAIALGLIWVGATRMQAPRSRVTRPRFAVAALVAWLAVAQYSARQIRISRPPTPRRQPYLFGLLIPLMTAGIGLAMGHRKPCLCDTACPGSCRSDLSHRGGIFLVLWADGRLPCNSLARGIGDSPPAVLLSSWQRCWRKRPLALAERPTSGASLGSPTSSWRLRWGHDFSGAARISWPSTRRTSSSRPGRW